MALRVIGADRNDFPKPFRDKVKQSDDGSFILDLSEDEFSGVTVANVQRLQHASEEWRRKYEDASRLAEKFEGLDPEDARKAIEAAKNPPKGGEGGISKEEIDRVVSERLKEASEAHKREIQKRDDELARERELGDRSFIKAQATDILGIDGIDPTGARLLLDRHMRIERDKDGNRKPVIVDDDGRKVLDSSFEHEISPKEWFSENVKSDPSLARLAFRGPGTSGAGGEKRHGSTDFTGGDGKKRVSITDRAALEKNIDAIASGEIEVTSD